jgi:hypothetical protein
MNAAVALSQMAELVTSAVETADDCSTGTSFPVRPNASWPEAFLMLSDVVGAVLHICNNLNG